MEGLEKFGICLSWKIQQHLVTWWLRHRSHTRISYDYHRIACDRFSQGIFNLVRLKNNAQLAACYSTFSSKSMCKTITVDGEWKGVRVGKCGKPTSNSLSLGPARLPPVPTRPSPTTLPPPPARCDSLGPVRSRNTDGRTGGRPGTRRRSLVDGVRLHTKTTLLQYY